VGPTTLAVDSTATSYGTYGIYIEFIGTIHLHENEFMTIVHDDGVSLMIDGELVSGLLAGPTSAVAQVFNIRAQPEITQLISYTRIISG
jgi:hypothetical protein